MSQAGVETEAAEWNKANLQKLFAAMKASIPEQERARAYNLGLKTLNWEEVAFPPFSPEECQQKWREIFQKMRKNRSLTELIVEAEDIISNPLHYKKIHPDFPKRPAPANAIYYEENFSRIQKQHPGMKTSKLFKIATKKFKALPAEEKEEYVEKQKTAVEEYMRKKLEFRKRYDKSHHDAADTTDTEDSDKDAEGLPHKPPLSGYSLFCKEMTSQKDMPDKNNISLWAKLWRDLSHGERNEYIMRCRELKRQYAINLDCYLKRFNEEKRQEIISKNNIRIPKRRKVFGRIAEKISGEPKMPARSGNVIFVKNYMKLLENEIPNSKERFAKASKMWHNLSEKEKEHYKQKGHEKMKQYSVELQKWFKTLTAEEQQCYRKHNRGKCQYLKEYEGVIPEVSVRKELFLNQPSDSEDEVIEESSSDEEENIVDLDEEDENEEEEEEDDMFEMY